MDDKDGLTEFVKTSDSGDRAASRGASGARVALSRKVIYHEGNTEVENYGYVVFTMQYLRNRLQLGKGGGGCDTPPAPISFY